VEGLELTDKDDHFFVSVLDVPSMTLTEVYPMTAERRFSSFIFLFNHLSLIPSFSFPFFFPFLSFRLAELANLYRIERSQNFFFFQMSARDD